VLQSSSGWPWQSSPTSKDVSVTWRPLTHGCRGAPAPVSRGRTDTTRQGIWTQAGRRASG
jgi:hypothetical protein